MLLVKLPEPVPFTVFVLKATVGVVAVLQTTPRAVTSTPPSAVTLPPVVAAAAVTELEAVVVTVAATARAPMTVADDRVLPV
jgi:hypothetical protein